MFRWAIVSNSTVAPLIPRLKKELKGRKYECELLVTEHGEAGREIFHTGSQLYAFKPDLVVLYLDLQQLRPGLELTLALESAEVRQSMVAEMVTHVGEVLKALRKNSAATILVNTFTVLPRTPLGIGLDPIYRRTIRQMNSHIEEAAANLPQCYSYDLES